MSNLCYPPAGWAGDPLALFIDDCRGNVFASFQKAPDRYQKLVAVESAIRLLCGNLSNAQNQVAPFFALKAHSSYLGAAHLAMSGQPPESFMLMRGCLEAALYGLYVSRTPGVAKVWFEREDSEEAAAACRKAFTTSKTFACIQGIDSSLHDLAKTLYDRTINLGAHPNVGSLAITTTVTKTEAGMHFKLAYLTEEPELITGLMKTVAQVGVCALGVFQHVFPEQFGSLALSAQMPGLRAGL